MSDAREPGRTPAHRWTKFAFDSAPRVIIGALLIVSVLINFANVVGRYLFDWSIYWAEEILVFLLLWSVFIGIVAVTYNGAHLSMDLISRRLTGWPQRALRGAVAVVLIACSAVVA